MKFKKLVYVILTSLLIFTQSGLALAAKDELKVNWVDGPKTVDVGDKLAKLKVPANFVFADGKDAKKIMEYFGNTPTDAEVGMVAPKDASKSWFVLFEYDELGYVKDDDAGSLDADGLLDSIKEGTEADNEDRKDRGEAPLNIIGWDEKPHYDSKTHNVVWSILAESEGNKIINYNVRILGRHGMTSVTLVADQKELESVKPQLATIVNNFEYANGKKYGDYVAGTDKVAELGLASLIAGGVAAKAGLFAKILILFKKVWFILFGILGAFYNKIKSFFGRGKEASEEAGDDAVEEFAVAEENAAVSQMAFAVEDSEAESKTEENTSENENMNA